MKSKIKHLLLTFDIEEFIYYKNSKSNKRELNKRELKRSKSNKDGLNEDIISPSLEGFRKIIAMLDREKLKATFFITEKIAKYSVKEIKYLIKKGHEIALHGKEHKDYSKLSKNEVIAELGTAKKNLERKFKIKIYGFRSPMFKRIDLAILRKLGFNYDSSIHPTVVAGRYNYLLEKTSPSKREGIFEVPISVTPYLRLPFSWIWFRVFGLKYAKLCSKSVINSNSYINVYFHSFEFCNTKKLDTTWMFKINTNKKFINNFGKYLKYLKSLNLKTTTMREFVQSINN